MKVRIVLVEPREAGNVGAAARAMKNFGVHDLWIVGRRPQRHDEVSTWWAAGADDIVENARRTGSLAEALADAHLAIATTAVRARFVRDVLYPDDAATLAHDSLDPDQRVAIVFGREESGLSQDEIAQCHRTATIPTDPAFPTMNLAQSVSLFCWEMRKAAAASRSPQRSDDERVPPVELTHRLRSTARSVLESIGFLNEHTGTRVMHELNAIADRALLDTRETSLLLALLRRLELRLGLRPSNREQRPLDQ